MPTPNSDRPGENGTSGANAELLEALSAEFTGTFSMVFFGCGAALFSSPSVVQAAAAVAFAVVIAVMIILLGDISGAHFNPAVTAGFLIAGKIAPGRALIYMLIQCVASIVAAFFLLWFSRMPGAPNVNPEGILATTTLYNLPNAGAAAVEFLISFLLMHLIFKVSDGSKEKGLLAGIAIGGYIGLVAYVAGPLTRASMNPARSLGPAIAAELGGAGGISSQLLLYLAVPPLGCMAAAFLHKVLHYPPRS